MPIIYKLKELPNEIEQINDVFISIGWYPRDKEKLKRALSLSYDFIIAYDKDKPVGLARIISDGEFYASLWDVVVHKDYQNKGIGKEMIDQLINRLPQSLTLTILLKQMDSPYCDTLYKNLGFKDINNAMALYKK